MFINTRKNNYLQINLNKNNLKLGIPGDING